MVLKSSPYLFPWQVYLWSSRCAWAVGRSGGQRQGTVTMVYNQLMAKLKSRIQIRNLLARQCLAEFLGEFVLMFFTLGAVAQSVTSKGAKGDFFTMFLAGALAVVAAIYVGGIVSGAHLNPAFSLTMCLLGRFPWVKLPIYALVQTFAAFCAAAATYVLYYGKSE